MCLRLDVVVATHRHFDHIAGFDSKLWDVVEVGEVWLPWTERRGDPIADDLRHRQHRLALALQNRFGRGTAGSLMALNALSNAGAERCLLSGFAGAPLRRFLPEPDTRELRSARLPGIVVHVLGPSRSLETIARLDPPPAEAFPIDEPIAGLPSQRVDGRRASAESGSESVPPTPLFAQRYVWHDSAEAMSTLAVDDKLLHKLETRAAADVFAAASALDDAINGTSLVLAFEVNGHLLLFGGDAEYGTWSEVLGDQDLRRLLARTTLYKVSHHGSYNGTPRSFVDELLPKSAILAGVTHQSEEVAIDTSHISARRTRGGRPSARQNGPDRRGTPRPRRPPTSRRALDRDRARISRTACRAIAPSPQHKRSPKGAQELAPVSQNALSLSRSLTAITT